MYAFPQTTKSRSMLSSFKAHAGLVATPDQYYFNPITRERTGISVEAHKTACMVLWRALLDAIVCGEVGG